MHCTPVQILSLFNSTQIFQRLHLQNAIMGLLSYVILKYTHKIAKKTSIPQKNLREWETNKCKFQLIKTFINEIRMYWVSVGLPKKKYVDVA